MLGEHQHEGQHGKHHQRQGDVHAQQHHEADHNLDARDEKLLRAVVGKLRHLKQVGGDAGHNLAYLGFGIIAEGQLLQVVEQVVAHVGFHPGAHNVSH